MIIKSAELGLVMATPAQIPRDGLPEVAFAGRSNVGKSSLINALLNRKKLAQTSSTPGKTCNIYFYRINQAFYFVDLPGYGYAQISHDARAYFKVLADAYYNRPNPPRVGLLLLDPKRPVGLEEMDFLRFMQEKGMESVVVFTRWDRLKNTERPAVKAQRISELGRLCKEPLFLSAKTKEGIDVLWKVIESHL